MLGLLGVVGPPPQLQAAAQGGVVGVVIGEEAGMALAPGLDGPEKGAPDDAVLQPLAGMDGGDGDPRPIGHEPLLVTFRHGGLVAGVFGVGQGPLFVQPHRQPCGRRLLPLPFLLQHLTDVAHVTEPLAAARKAHQGRQGAAAQQCGEGWQRTGCGVALRGQLELLQPADPVLFLPLLLFGPAAAADDAHGEAAGLLLVAGVGQGGEEQLPGVRFFAAPDAAATGKAAPHANLLQGP